MTNSIRVHASTKDDASQPLDKLRDKIDRLQKQGAKGFAIGAGAAITAKGLALIDTALSKVGEAVFDSIQNASDLNETLTKSGQVFGDSADEMEAWGDTAARSMGISKNAALGAAAGFGDLFNKMEETRDGSADMAKNLVELASDLASFNNLDPTEVLDKLRAGLSGEAEPLRRVGVFLNEAKVQAKALELGFVPLNGKLTDGAKIAARYALIMEETASAHGDFARTSDGLANKQRQVNAMLEDASAKFGQKLLPVLEVFAKVMTDRIIPALDDFVTNGLPSLQGMAEDAAGMVSFLAENLGFLAKTTELATIPLRAVIFGWERVGEVLGWVGDRARETFGIMDDGAREAEKAVGGMVGRGFAGMPEAAAKARELAKDTEKIGKSAQRAERRVDDSLDEIVTHFRRAQSDLETAASNAASAIYDPIIAKAELAATEREIAEQKQIIASKKSTKEQVRDAKLRMAELNKRRIELIGELEGYGKRSRKQQVEFIRDLQKQWTTATRRQRAEIDLLIRQLMALKHTAQQAAGAYKPGMGIGTGSGGRASGGPVKKGELYEVGEAGREWFVPHADGQIIPNHVVNAVERGRSLSAVGATGGGMTLNLTVNAGPGMTPGMARQLGEALMPAIYEQGKRRGLW